MQALHTITSRSTRSDENAVVSVTQFHAGEATNVLPDSAVLKGTIRDLDPAVFDLIEKRIAEGDAELDKVKGDFAELAATLNAHVEDTDELIERQGDEIRKQRKALASVAALAESAAKA